MARTNLGRITEEIQRYGCYCMYLPRDDEGQLLARCNLCWNGIVQSKGELVRENQELRRKLDLPGVELA